MTIDRMCTNCLARIEGHCCPGVEPGEQCLGGEPSYAVTQTLTIDKFRGEYSFLSNFYIEPDGTFVERDFQAGKASNKEDLEFVLKATTPSDARKRGRSRAIQVRRDWEEVKVDLMLRLVRQKFKDHPLLAAKLLATGDVVLVEGNTWGDTFWGAVNGKGKNTLGVILHIVRYELRRGLS